MNTAVQTSTPLCEWDSVITKGQPFDVLETGGNVLRIAVEDADDGQSRVTVQLMAGEAVQL
jgi:hypothetical protein